MINLCYFKHKFVLVNRKKVVHIQQKKGYLYFLRTYGHLNPLLRKSKDYIDSVKYHIYTTYNTNIQYYKHIK